MKMQLLWIPAAFALAACGQPGQAPLPPVAVEPPGNTFDALEDDAFSHGIMTLRFYDDAPTGEISELPRFELASSRCRYEEGDVWSFEDADAVIRGNSETEMRIEAGFGRVDHRTKHAFMEGGVRLTTGDLIIEMEELTWSNADRVASSEQPVRILQGGTDLHASSMQLYPDESRVVLHEARGRIERVDTLGLIDDIEALNSEQLGGEQLEAVSRAAEATPEMEMPPA